MTIAGHDPSSGAGVTADLAVFAAHRLFGTSVLTSLTVQSTLGVASQQPLSPEYITESLACLTSDLPPAGIKIGMLSQPSVVAAVAGFLAGFRQRNPATPVVLDPVLQSSSGRELLSPEGLLLLKRELLPHVDCITPNVDELGILTAKAPAAPIPQSLEARISAARELQRGYPRLHVLVTGGHLDPPEDLLVSSSGLVSTFPGQRIQTRSTHGTGCAFSSALLSRLILGDSLPQACAAAKHYVAQALRLAPGLGQGKGPLALLWPLLKSP